MKYNFLYLVGALLLASCGATRDLVYFSDLQEQAVHTEQISNMSEVRIQPDDLLNITISSLNPESNALFNRGAVPPVNITGTYGVTTPNQSVNNEGYLVGRDGGINFPVLGKIQLGGLTKQEARSKIESLLSEYLKDPIVNIHFLNFKVTVVGEVNRPASFTIPSDRINILEALGMAGDMTVFGKRENVLIIREQEGIRTVARLNLNSNHVLNSPYFYLQQNDVVYVEPDKGKGIQNNPNNRWIPIVAAAVSSGVILIANLLIR